MLTLTPYFEAFKYNKHLSPVCFFTVDNKEKRKFFKKEHKSQQVGEFQTMIEVQYQGLDSLSLSMFWWLKVNVSAQQNKLYFFSSHGMFSSSNN